MLAFHRNARPATRSAHPASSTRPDGAVRRDVQEVAGRHLDRLFVILEPKPRCAAQDHDPFRVILVVPETRGRGVALGDDALDADVGGFDQGGAKLVGKTPGEVSEKVGADGHGSGVASLPYCLPACGSAWAARMGPSRSSTSPHGEPGGQAARHTPGAGRLRLGNHGGWGKTEAAGETDRAPAGIPALARAVTNAARAGGVHAYTP